MSSSKIGDILATELAKISDQIVFWCIVIAIGFVLLGLIIYVIKKLYRGIFKK